MNKIILLPFLSILLVSCDPEMHKFPHERTPVKKPAIKKPAIKKPKPSIPLVTKPKRIPAPSPSIDLSSAFLAPTKDTNLPSNEQLADDVQSAIGNTTPSAEVPTIQVPTIAPSTPIVPPVNIPAPEDDLFPTE